MRLPSISSPAAAAFLCVPVLALSIGTLVGRQFDITSITSFSAELVAMNSLTAITFLLCSWLLLAYRENQERSLLHLTIAIAVSLVGLIRAIEVLTGISTGFDQTLFAQSLATQPGGDSMAPNTAFNFLLLGMSLFGMHLRTPFSHTWYPALAVPPLFLALVALLGYAVGVNNLFTIQHFAPMALSTTLCFIAIAIAIIARSRSAFDNLRTHFVWRVYAGYAAIIIITTLVIALALDRFYFDYFQGEADRRLMIQADLLGASAKPSLIDPSIPLDTAQLKSSSKQAATRLTLVGIDGRVLFDSDYDIDQVPADLLTAAEFAVAREGQRQFVVRDSTMTGLPTRFYVAPIFREGVIVGYARAGMLESEIHQQLTTLRASIISRTGFAGVFALLLGLLFARRVTRPLAEMTSWAQQIARGENPPQIICSGDDEIGQLAKSFQMMNIQLADRIDSLRLSRAAAESANEAKSMFLATMSHEIRTPLNGVIGILDLLNKTALSPQQQKYLDLSRHSAEILHALIEDVLDFSKIEANKMELVHRPFDLREVTEEATELLGSRALAKKLELICFVDPKLPKRFIGDGQRIRQVVLNLVSNSIKFTEKGEVTVKVTGDETQPNTWRVRCHVIDTGIGIPVEKQARLFQPFVQADQSMTRTYPGTGLGLAISRKLIQLMSGTINFTSVPTKGSDFWFEVLLKSVPQTDDKPAEPLPHIRSIKVLAMDDNDLQRSILADQIRGWGFDVSTAATGQAALGALAGATEAQTPFTVALLDQVMPDLGALELAKIIKKSSSLKQTALMILLCDEEPPNPQKLRSLGFSGYLTKPIRQSLLFDAIVDAVFGPPLAGADRYQSKTSIAVPNDDGARILIVEDNHINQIVASEILTQAGYRCDVVKNGREAIDVTASSDYDLILMDCHMPVMDGFATTKLLRDRERTSGSSAKRIPIIAVTAIVAQGDRERCLAAGMDAYVSKPIEAALLLRAVSENLLPRVGRATQIVDAGGGLAAKHKVAPTSSKQDFFEAPFDVSAIVKRYRANREMVQMILVRFPNETSRILKQIDEGFEAANAEALTNLAHELKGLAGVICATKLYDLAQEMENSGKRGEIAEMQKLLAVLRLTAESCAAHVPEALANLESNSLN